MKVKTTDRGWAGHYIMSRHCLFRRNTLIESGKIKIVVSSVGNLYKDKKIQEIGNGRYFETMAFHSKKDDNRYHDADVQRPVKFISVWRITMKGSDDVANIMHDDVVNEITARLKAGELFQGE